VNTKYTPYTKNHLLCFEGKHHVIDEMIIHLHYVNDTSQVHWESHAISGKETTTIDELKTHVGGKEISIIFPRGLQSPKLSLEHIQHWSSIDVRFWGILFGSFDSRRINMATGYSLDLRTRVMDDLDRGLSPEEAAEKYSVTARTIYSWKLLKRETGDIAPRQGKTGPKRKLDPHREAILARIRENSDLTLEELILQLELPGCLQTLSNALHRWGIVLKKSHARHRTAAA